MAVTYLEPRLARARGGTCFVCGVVVGIVGWVEEIIENDLPAPKFEWCSYYRASMCRFS